MADQRMTWAALAVLYADNTAGAISPQDLRHGFASVKPHVAADAPTASDDETLGFDVGHAWIDTSTSPRSVYECVDASTGEAVWVKRYPQDAGDVDAGDVDYNNASSGLAAEDVQAAIDELASEKADTSSLGTAAAADTGDFATAAQGALADAALPKIATVATEAGNHTLDSNDSGAYIRVTGAATITLPDGLSTGFQCVIVNATDSDTVVLSAATTLTIPAGFEPEIQNRRAVTVIHVGSNVWEAHGALVEEED